MNAAAALIASAKVRADLWGCLAAAGAGLAIYGLSKVSEGMGFLMECKVEFCCFFLEEDEGLGKICTFSCSAPETYLRVNHFVLLFCLTYNLKIGI